MKARIIYGSDTGSTEYVIENYLVDQLSLDFEVQTMEVNSIDPDVWDTDDLIIIGLSTWYDGVLQSDWEEYFDDFKKIDFTGKIVAIFGLGDQVGYGEFFVDGVGIIAKEVLANGGTIIGNWPNEGYEFIESKASINENTLYGLALDEDNQDEYTYDRVKDWAKQIKEEYASILFKELNDLV